MSNTPDPLEEDQLGLTADTLDQWETELDAFAVDIIQRLKLITTPDSNSPDSDPDE